MPSPLLGLRLSPLAASGSDREYVVVWLDEPVGDQTFVQFANRLVGHSLSTWSSSISLLTVPANARRDD
jgi:hypothetical protein